MPIIRKLLNLHSSKGVVIPKGWLEYYRRIYGCEIDEVEIEVGDKLIISPILPKQKHSRGEG